ncbi:MAG: hypothetical protein CL693_04400 [Cellvibrionaceae bacterium]|nr:hypothetical protein [Cellvibrionaceae bacterium]|tara:strand:+ start:32880 stop:33320 length:441 start_codon:yes stop_codon:yes gene_type:complete
MSALSRSNRNQLIRTTLLIASSALILGGCSSQDKRKRPSLTETFETEITQDGSKRFVYQVSPDRSKGGRPPRNRDGKPPSKGGQMPSDRSAKIAERTETMLQEKLAKTEFCQEGHMVLDSFFDRGGYTIRGECRDEASEGDRAKFI